jgi:hypothetical protein
MIIFHDKTILLSYSDVKTVFLEWKNAFNLGQQFAGEMKKCPFGTNKSFEHLKK